MENGCKRTDIKSRKPNEPNYKLYVCLSVHRCICVEKNPQLDVTECFITIMIPSTYSGHFYAHHQEFETICVLLSPMLCSALSLVVGGQVQDRRLLVQEGGCCTTRAASLFLDTHPAALHLTPTASHQALRTIGSNSIHIVKSSWWWS